MDAESAEAKAYAINQGKFQTGKMTYGVGLMSACEILSLYSDINTRCIEHGKEVKKPKNRYFVELTRIMVDIK